MGYYVDLDADQLAEELYRAHEKEREGQAGTVLGTVGRNQAAGSSEQNDENPYGQGVRRARPAGLEPATGGLEIRCSIP